MLTDLRHALTPRRVLLSVLLLIGVALMLPWLPPYAPLSDRLTERYLEAHGRSRRQIEQRTAAERRAAEEAQQRQRAEEESTRQQREFVSVNNEFRRVGLVLSDPTEALTKNALAELSRLNQAARSPQFYANQRLITPDDTLSNRACSDPATTRELVTDRAARRRRNIFACYTYHALNRTGGMMSREVSIAAIAQRMVDPQGNPAKYPFQTIIAYIWVEAILAPVLEGQLPPPLPALNDGDRINPALLTPVMAQGFAEWLIEDALTAEKLALRSDIYPLLKQWHELAVRLVSLCKATKRARCFGN